MIRHPRIAMHYRLPQTLVKMGIWLLTPTSW